MKNKSKDSFETKNKNHFGKTVGCRQIFGKMLPLFYDILLMNYNMFVTWITDEGAKYYHICATLLYLLDLLLVKGMHTFTS